MSWRLAPEGEGIKIFPSPRANIKGESSEFFEVPGPLYREKAIIIQQ